MLSIDEAIAHARENYNDIINTTYNKCQYEHLSCEGCATPTCKEIADENLQLAEWLEELKSIKDGSIPIIHGKAELELHDKAIRNEAIDDFVKKICEKYTEEESKGNYKQYCGEIKQNISDIAEQLKEKNK